MKKYSIKLIFSTYGCDTLQEAEEKAKFRLNGITAQKDKIKYGNENLFKGFKLDYNYKAHDC